MMPKNKDVVKRTEAILTILSGENPLFKLALAQHIASCDECNERFVAIIEHFKNENEGGKLR